MIKYFISKSGKQLGPWTRDEVLFQLKSNLIDWADYVYDEQKVDWVLLAEHADFFSFFKNNTQVQPPVKASTKVALVDVTQTTEWFVLKGENKYGPFSYLEIVRLLQEKNLFEFDYVWNGGLASWMRLSDCQDFKPEKIRHLLSESPTEKEDVFFRRRHARAKYGASVLVHNNKTVWKGHSLEISAGGAGLMTDTNTFEPGQTIFLHFKVGDEVPPFNAICSVISKQILPDGKSTKYGVKFVNISREIQHAIKNFAEKAA